MPHGAVPPTHLGCGRGRCKHPARLWSCISVLVLICSIGFVSAFKDQEFKKCKDASFCVRNRGRTGTKYVIADGSVKTGSNGVTALITNVDSSTQFTLTITPYRGFVRVIIDEADVGTKRYQVPDVLSDIHKDSSEFTGATVAADRFSGTVGLLSVDLKYKPFRLDVSLSGDKVMSLNPRDMFNFEHRRAKQESDPAGWWDESFNNHPDTKPKGPEAISLDISFPQFEHVYGIPERATRLSLKPTTGSSEPYRLYNLDVFEYLHESPFGLYGSIPFMLGHRLGATVGVLWLNAAEMFVDVDKSRSGTSVQWITESGIVDLFIMAAAKPNGVVQQYASITGTTALPQLFALGYHQCRWNYKDEADVAAVDAGFDQHAIPYDVIWLDIEHSDGKRYMTWDSRYFPTPVRMQEDVASRGRRMVTIVDPHVKRDYGYELHKEAESKGYYVKNRDSGVFDGWCWPGASSYLDHNSPVVREWWAQQFSLNKYVGSTKHLYIWNDMNEPSVFNGPEITMPKDNKHYGDIEHRDVHNMYGYYYHMATAMGLQMRGYEVDPEFGDRPFVLSRAFFSGTQRIGPIWTGDNTADWNHLKVSVPMLLTLGVTGLPFSGADVGGFFGNPDAELLTRWYQVGIYYPFFRGHAHIETQRREPWVHGDPTTGRVRAAIRERYALLPYIYTLFRHANTTGEPVIRPLWYEFPDNKGTFDADEVLLLGPSMLVCPVMAAGVNHVDCLLPKEATWYNTVSGVAVDRRQKLMGTEQTHRFKVDMEGIPVFYRGGGIVARRERPRRSTTSMALDPLTLVVALDDAQFASGSVYMDDGHSFAFRKGHYMHRQLTFGDLRLNCSSFQEPEGVPQGSWETPVLVERVVLLGLPKGTYKATAILADGSRRELTIAPGPVSLIAPSSRQAMVIRKPELAIAADWAIQLSSATS